MIGTVNLGQPVLREHSLEPASGETAFVGHLFYRARELWFGSIMCQ